MRIHVLYIRTQVERAKYQISRFDDAGGFLLLNTRRVSALHECHILLAHFIFAHVGTCAGDFVPPSHLKSSNISQTIVLKIKK